MDFAEVVRQYIVAAILKGMLFSRHKRLARHGKKRFILSNLQLLAEIGAGQNGINLFDRSIMNIRIIAGWPIRLGSLKALTANIGLKTVRLLLKEMIIF